MIAIPNMDMPETCDMCPIEGCEYINGKFTCPLIEIDDELISKFAEAYLEREAEDGNIHT